MDGNKKSDYFQNMAEAEITVNLVFTSGTNPAIRRDLGSTVRVGFAEGRNVQVTRAEFKTATAAAPRPFGFFLGFCLITGVEHL
jgi:hypothetical protein